MSETTSADRPGPADHEAPLRRPDEVTVLVVDDEPDVVTYLSSVLEDAGLNVLTAYDGDQALEILRERGADLISLDLVMPRKSGIRLLVELRKTRAWSRIPVIFVTGHARDPDVRRDMDQVMADSTMMGPSLYLEKPVTPESYLAHICKILRVDIPEEFRQEGRADELRREARELLDQADPQTLQALLEQLKKSKT
jgi:CheY-like chemotaxis protein